MADTFERLTAAERLLIDRRRRDENQREAARRHNTTPSVYQAMELGIYSLLPTPKVNIGPLARHERCHLRRRRAKQSRAWLAEQVGCSQRWVTLMERGEVPCDRLWQFWEK